MSMKHHLVKIILAAGFISLSFSGCRKPSDDIGSDIGVVGGTIGSAFTDTLTLKAISVREDSLRTDRTSLAPFGSFFDPYFGITTSSLYLNFALNQVFSSGLTGVNQVDSVVLRIRFGSPTHFGDIGKYKGLIRVTVFRLLDKLTVQTGAGAGYFSTRNFTVDPTPVGSGSILGNPFDSVKVDGKNEAPHIRLKLNNSFGTALLTGSSSAFSSTELFLEYFKGLYLKVTPADQFGAGGFLYLLPPANGSRLTVYYNDTSRINMVVNPDNSVWITRHEHNYGYALPPFTNFSTPVSGEQNVLIQPLSGSKTKIFIPHLKNFSADKSIAVNKAELVFPVDDAFTGKYPVPTQLLLARYDAQKDSLFNLADFVQSQGNNGGLYNSERKEYTFNITLHVQAVLSGLTSNDTLVLESANKQTRGNRVALMGTDRLTDRMRLRIYYTKLQ